MLPASADVEREAFQKRNLEQRITHTHARVRPRKRIVHTHTQAIGTSAAFQESPPREQKDQLLGQWTLVQGYLLRSSEAGGQGCCCPVAQSCPTLCNPTDCSTPGFPVMRYVLEFAQTQVH